LEKEYGEILDEKIEYTSIRIGGPTELIHEFFISYIFFVLFFHFPGRTPGKKLFGLKVIDLHGNGRIGWYQAFERTHGYVASGLSASLGFLQVLWDSEGKTMHDKISGTTVIRLPQKIKRKKSKRPKKSL